MSGPPLRLQRRDLHVQRVGAAGDRLAWWQRSDAAYCSAACRQASYRVRVA